MGYRVVTAGLAVAALIAAPVSAHDRRPSRSRDNGGVGSFLAGALIAGGVVALLAGKRHASPAVPPDVPLAYTDVENDAANRCADAIERQSYDDGREARVERIVSVVPREKGGYKVKGDVRVADTGDGYTMHFSCIVKASGVQSTTMSI